MPTSIFTLNRLITAVCGLTGDCGRS